MISSFLLIFLTSLIISFLLIPAIKRWAHQIGAMDYPGKRRVNDLPVPNIGGLAIYAGFVITVLLFLDLSRTLTGILIGGTLITFIGFIDDLYEISPIWKLLGQILTAVILIGFGIKIEFITNPLGGMYFLGNWGIPLTIIWVVSLTNVVNLIDGLDGLAAGVSAIAVITLFLVSLQEGQTITAIMALSLAGSILGFLYYNFHPADIFMGDSGSMFLGYILASISIAGALKSAAAITLVVPVMALGVPILDTAFAIIRRIYHNKPISEADKGHVHHRLLALGWSQQEAVLIVYGISIFLGLTALLINGISLENGIILTLFVFVSILFGAWKIGIFNVDLPAENAKMEESNL